MQRIRTQDNVIVIKGKDKDKRGKVLKVFRVQAKALVESINLVKKHKRKTQQDQQGGVVSVESPIALSNLMLVCKHCDKPSRTGIKILSDGTKARFCKNCKEAF